MVFTCRIMIPLRSEFNCDFTITPEPVVDYRNVVVRQMEGTGDLVFTMKTGPLFSEERPVKVLLRWEGGDAVIDTGSQMFVVDQYDQVLYGDNSALWSFSISRSQIEDSILCRKNGFDVNTRYLNSEIMTSAVGYPIFRKGNWEYPVQKDNHITFAPQRFRKPSKPAVSEPIMSHTDAAFYVNDTLPGLKTEAVVRLSLQLDDTTQVHNVERILDVTNASTSEGSFITHILNSTDWVMRRLDWNFSRNHSTGVNGRGFASGYLFQDTSIISQGGTFQNSIKDIQTDSVPFTSWYMSIPKDGTYHISFHAQNPNSFSDTIWYSLGENRPMQAYVVEPESGGWHAAQAITGNYAKDLYDLKIYAPDSSSLILKAVGLKKQSVFMGSPQENPNTLPHRGLFNTTAIFYDFQLRPDAVYDMEVFLRDRYGNESEKVTYTGLRTVDELFKGKVIVHQEDTTGELVLELHNSEQKQYRLESIGFALNNCIHTVNVNELLPPGVTTTVKFGRDKLNHILNNPEFLRRTEYDSLFMVVASDTSYTDTVHFSYACETCAMCDTVTNEYAKIRCNTTVEERAVRKSILGVISWTDRETVVFRSCDGSLFYPEEKTIRTTIPLKWPGGTRGQVASQEYRTIQEPVVEVRDTTHKSLTLTCSNLDPLGRQQMAGNLNVTWTPGSLCQDTSFSALPFGTRFKMHNNWIAFKPNFGAAIGSNVGKFRKHLDSAIAVKHQWLDNTDELGSVTGGEFFPNTGDSVRISEFVNGTLDGIPSVSFGFHISASEASQSRTDDSEKFKLWVLPADNGSTSSRFYWSVDDSLLDIGSALPPANGSWREGPLVALDSGNHTLDLFMIDDGVGIKGIALSKIDRNAPSFAESDLPEWGDTGFDLALHVDELPYNRDIKFFYQAIDRFGNASPADSFVVKTLSDSSNIPSTVITPDLPLVNSFYESVYPTFTITLGKTFHTLLDLDARLIRRNGAAPEYEFPVTVQRIDGGNKWSIAVDSSQGLPEFPSGAVTSDYCYSIQTRAVALNGKEGDWTQQNFGIVAASNENPQSVVIENPEFIVPDLHFRYEHGFLSADTVIVGDLEVVLDDRYKAETPVKLMLEGARIFTRYTEVNDTIVHHEIDSIRGGSFAAYGYDDYSYLSKIKYYAFNYGKHLFEADADSLFLFKVGGNSNDTVTVSNDGTTYKIASGASFIRDDNDNPVRISADPYNVEAVPFTRIGVVDTFYSFSGLFFLKNVLTFSDMHPGFNIEACIMRFSRTTGTEDHYSLKASGECYDCGPYLQYEVMHPNYMYAAFSVYDRLQDTVLVSYSSSDPQYSLQSGMSNSVSESTAKNLDYMNWTVSFDSYRFTNSGIVLDSFSIGLNEETFPGSKNGQSTMVMVSGFQNSTIHGDQNVNSGALHLFGDAAANTAGLSIATSDDYIFRNFSEMEWKQNDNREYLLYMPQGYTLATPTWKNREFYETIESNDTLSISVTSGNGFIAGPNGIVSVEASDDNFSRSFGTLALFTIKGKIDISYAARAFQIKISPNGHDSIFTVKKEFFEGEDSDIGLLRGSVGFFSDFSINTLYGKKEVSHYLNIRPEQFKNIITVPCKGFDVFQTDQGLRLLSHAPEFGIGQLGKGAESLLEFDSDCNFETSIYNAGFDFERKITNISGRIDLPDNIASCFGKNGIAEIEKQVASFIVKTIYLGYDKATSEHENDKFTIGTDATINLGEAFRCIGMNNEKIRLSELVVSYDGKWSLEKLRASAFTIPRSFGIGPDNLRKDASQEGDNPHYAVLSNGGHGLNFSYSKEETRLNVNMKNWQLSITDKFPVKQLHGVSFLLDEFEYQKKLGKSSDPFGEVTRLKAAVDYVPPERKLTIYDYGLLNAKVSLDCDMQTDSANHTSLNAYLSVTFDTLLLGDKILEMGCGGTSSELRIYFDGRFFLNGCVVWRDTIGIIPFGEEENPELFIDPGKDGTQIPFTLSNEGFRGGLRNVRLRSKNKIPVLDTVVNVNVNEAIICISRDKFTVDSLDVDWNIYRTVIDESAFKVAFNTLSFKYGNESRLFTLTAVPAVHLKLGDACTSQIVPRFSLFGNVDNVNSFDDLEIDWDLGGMLSCQIGNMGFDAWMVMKGDTVGFDSAFVDMTILKEYGLLKSESATPGVAFSNVFWVKNRSTGKWVFQSLEKKDINVLFDSEQGFELSGVKVIGEMDYGRLFTTPFPGIGYKNIKVKLSENFGGTEIPTGMSLYIDGRKPYFHPEYNQPKAIVIPISKFKLVEGIGLTDAIMAFGVEDTIINEVPVESWYFRGKGTMNLKGAVDNISVDLALEKPQPPINTTGIRHAKLTIKMAKSSRIPIGATGFYISGFEGALYDGLGMPKGAVQCNIPQLPPGLKLEAAMYVEFEEPKVANGKVGFWVHLRRLNFGVNGDVAILEGIARADACLALYDNGRAFHGAFNVIAELGATVKGSFLIDVWQDEDGGNFTADASASLGLRRGSLLKIAFIKIPSKTFWLGDVYTKAGKFENRKTGFTAGIRVAGRRFGVGIINRKFKVGNMNKLRLKQPPRVTQNTLSTLALGKTTSLYSSTATTAEEDQWYTSGVTFKNPGIVLEGDEVLTFFTAVNTGLYQWPDSLLRVKDPATGLATPDSCYYPLYGNERDYEQAQVEYNTYGRTWVNPGIQDSILVGFADPLDSVYFQTMIFADLKPAVPAITASVTTDTVQKVVLNGEIPNFQNGIRNIVGRSEDGTPDTLLSQKMRLKFFSSSLETKPTDSVNTKFMYNYVEIPREQFENWDSTTVSFVQTDTSKTLLINGLVWNTAHVPTGKYAVSAAVEVLDFIMMDEEGNKVILPDTSDENAAVFRENPVIAYKEGTDDILAVTVINKTPVQKPKRFTATGSAVGTQDSWFGTDETRSIFLRWEQDNNPAMAGYAVSWMPNDDKTLERKAYIGKTDNFVITIPGVTDDIYADDSSDAAGILDIGMDERIVAIDFYKVSVDGPPCDDSVAVILSDGEVVYNYFNIVYDTIRVPEVVGEGSVVRPNRVYGDSVGIDYYRADSFTVTLTPIRTVLKEIVDPGAAWKDSALMITEDSSKSVTIRNVYIGNNSGKIRNNFALAFNPEDSVRTRVIPVPLNESKSVDLDVVVKNRVVSDTADPSDYGEVITYLPRDTSDAPFASVGAAKTHFAVEDSVITTRISFTPVSKTETCKDLYAGGCTKIVRDTLLGIDSTSEVCGTGCVPANEECTSCDPNAPDNDLPRMDPCNGRPDYVVRQQAPFDTFTVFVGAVNNGRRAKPVQNSADGAAAVYDSLVFLVTPPRPVLHNVSPSYILKGRSNTLNLAVSGLWKDTSDIRAEVRIPTEDSLYRYELIWRENVFPMIPSEDDPDWKTETNAEYAIRIGTRNIRLSGTGEMQLSVSVVNKDASLRGDSLYTEGNSFEVAYVVTPEEIECPQGYYDCDSANADLLMDWIGIYPKKPSPGQTVTMLFTELHDIDPANYKVALTRVGNELDTTFITDFRVDYSGIEVTIPDSGTGFYNLAAMLWNSDVIKCARTWWSQRIEVVPARVYRINPDESGFRLVLDSGRSEHRHLDHIQYLFGYYTQNTLHDEYTTTYHEFEPIPMSRSNWVTVIISDVNKGNKRFLHRWIDIQENPRLYYTDGSPVSQEFIASPGDTLIVSQPTTDAKEFSSPYFYTTSTFADDRTVKGNTIVFNSASKPGSLLLESWAEAFGPDGKETYLNGLSVYNYTLHIPDADSSVMVTLPHRSIKRALKEKIFNYPLLLRLDTTNAPGLANVIRTPFYVADRCMDPLPFEIERIDTLQNELDLWVRMDTLDPQLGNHALYLINGERRSSQSVWEKYRGVYHCTEPGLLRNSADNTGTIPIEGTADRADGIVSTGIHPLQTSSLTFSENIPAVMSDTAPGVSLSAWIKLDSMPLQRTDIISYVNGDGTVASALSVNPDGSILWTVGGDTLRSIRGAVETNVWLHIAGTYSWFYADGNGSIYVNGMNLKSLKMNGGEKVHYDDKGTIRVGGDEMNRPFPGKIDELRISSNATNPAWLYLDYHSQRALRDFMKQPEGRTSVVSVSNPAYRLIPAEEGQKQLFGNSSWKLDSLHKELKNTLMVQIPYSERMNSEDTLFTVKLNGPARVSVLIDDREGLPEFMSQGYVRKNIEPATAVEKQTGYTRSMNMYSLDVNGPGTLAFGGPGSGNAENADLPYAAFIDCMDTPLDSIVTSSDTEFVAIGDGVEEGAFLYSDREYLIDSLDSDWPNAVMVRPSNSFKHSTGDEYFSLSFPKPAVVSLLIDSTADAAGFPYGEKWAKQSERVYSENRAFSVYNRKVKGTLMMPGPRVNGATIEDLGYSLIVARDTVFTPVIAVCSGILDLGSSVYSDTDLIVTEMPQDLVGATLVCTKQSDFDNAADVLEFETRRDAWIYCALEVGMSKPPAFISDNWEITNRVIKTDAAGFILYRKRFAGGIHVFEGIRSGGENQNRFNYFFVVDSRRIIPQSEAGQDTLAPNELYGIKSVPGELSGLIVKSYPKMERECVRYSYRVDRPLRVWLGVDPNMRTSGTFLVDQNWTRTVYTVELNSGKELVMWTKEFSAGYTEIPGVHCAYNQPQVLEPLIAFEYMANPFYGYAARELAVRGIGNERWASSETYLVRNLDVVYACETGMSSNSWKMNMTVSGAVSEPGDTVRVLAPFSDTVVTVDGNKVVQVDSSFALSDLVPALVNADMVSVNAIDLRTYGQVRVAFANRSQVPVEKAFKAILFEDMDNDFEYNRFTDHVIGRIIVDGLAPNEYRLFSIDVGTSLSFPDKYIFTFVDEDYEIEELIEYNNVMSSDNVCKNYYQPEFVEPCSQQCDSLTSNLPEFRDTTVFCYLRDTNGDLIIDYQDSLSIVYTEGGRLHAVMAHSLDTLFTPFYIDMNSVTKVNVADFDGDGVPELIAGNRMYSTEGALIYDFSTPVPSPNFADLPFYDFDRDGDRDHIEYVDSCTVIRRGRDNAPLFVYPLSRWTGETHMFTKEILADIAAGEHRCYDLNVSYPRHTVMSGDTVQITVRIANVGAASASRGIKFRVYADTITENGATLIDSLTGRRSDWAVRKASVSELCTKFTSYEILPGKMKDFTVKTIIPADAKRLWFVLNEDKEYFEIETENNILTYELEEK